MMTASQLTALRTRMTKAARLGHGVAKASLYMQALAAQGGSADPPTGCAKGSAAHLLAMTNAALAGGGKKAAAPKKAAPAPKQATPPPPSGDDDDDGYEDWTKAELMAEAKERDMDAKSSMNKADLVEMLYANDESDGDDE